MAYSRGFVLICACALIVRIAALPAPPRRSADDRDNQKMVQEKTIVIRRVPNAYVYPFSLWPLPKYPIRDDPTVEYIFNGKMLKKLRVKQNKR